MRLHHLRAEAFGPFKDAIEVDFDQLSAAGLFLLTGSTGAGKTSVLDAVCFALYGGVPGARNGAKRLRSDLAEPHVVPRVELEVTLAGRRFRIVRSPAWERPKKRGAGTTPEPAKVALSEFSDGAWVPLSSRIDEVGDLVGALLGMNVHQFTQVALLPQGQFETFLRADSEDRHKVLAHLFRTGRYEDVEAWLREHRSRLNRRHDEHHQQVADVVSRISEAAAAGLDEVADLDDLGPAADDGSLAAWATGLSVAAVKECDRRTSEAGTLAAAERSARSALEEARAAAKRQAAVREARKELAELEAAAGDQAARKQRAHEAQRAEQVRPLHDLSAQAAEQLVRATAHHRGALVALATLEPRPDLDPAAVLTSATEGAARVKAVIPRADRLDELSTRRDRDRDALAEAERHLARIDTESDAIPTRLTAARADLADVGELAQRVPALTMRAESLEQRERAHQDGIVVEGRLREAQALHHQARETSLGVKEQLLDLQERRIAGMAAELAGGLAVGCACPVCGSAEHPHKARAAADAPDAQAEKAMRARLADAEIEEQARSEKCRDLERSLTALRATAGDVEGLAAECASVRTDLARAQEAERALGAAEAQVRDLEHRLEELRTTRNDLATEVTQRRAELEALEAEIAALDAEISAVLSGTGQPDLESLLGRHREVIGLCRTAIEAAADLAQAEKASAEAERQLADVVARAGFADLAHALAALLSDVELAELTEQVRAHERRCDELTGLLRDAEPSTGALPDVDALERAHVAAHHAWSAAEGHLKVWQRRAQRLAELGDELDTLLERWAPLRRERDVAVRLSTFVEGRAHDNRLKMRLSAYVLAYRLTQVVNAANQRLSAMLGGRYLLEHTEARARRETRGGLSLQMRDSWNGQARHPGTLSGGETFVVSLALALGLADVIGQEAGGVSLDTLFVDEGFGSLDAHTLDEVMNTLDTLREGGRVVGVVSHVTELRDRIPAQLRVEKGQSGSRLSVSVGLSGDGSLTQ